MRNKSKLIECQIQNNGRSHPKRSRGACLEVAEGICLQMSGTHRSRPDVSTPRCSARHDRWRVALNRRAFTLIELLVVIAIIALLMAILMPTLARVRKQAKAVVCQSNLHQWGHSILMYTSDNNYYFMKGWMWQVSDFWIDALRPYYANEPKLRCCPTAKKTWTEGGSSTFSAWGKFDERELALPDWASKGDYGSYGINEWVYHPPPEIKTATGGRPTTYNWRTMNVKGGSDIPLFLDCFWVGGEVLADDPPPPFDGVELIFGEEMKFFCLN